MRGSMSLDVFFKPRSVAIVGASRSEEKVGHVILRRMVEIGFEGKIYPINPNADEILGIKCYKSISDIPESVDLVVVAVRADATPAVIEEAADKGARGALVISGGFSEVGNWELERKLVEVARKRGIRVIGPNCLGIFDPKDKIDTLFLPERVIPRPGEGKIAVITQSGSLGSTVLTMMRKEGMGISKFVSYGNRADVDEGELLEYLMEDEDTEVIAAYIESVADGRKFMESMRRASRRKPVVVLKGGKTSSGDRAVRSHTGSMAGSSEIFHSAVKQSGGIVVSSLGEFLDSTQTLVSQPPMSGDRVAVITNGGGFGILAVDALESIGFRLNPPSERLERKLREVLPPYYPVGNPTDLTGDSTPEQFLEVGSIFSESGEYDALFIIPLLGVPAMIPDRTLKALSELLKSSKIPIVAVAVPTTDEVDSILRELKRRGLPVFPTPERAAYSLLSLKKYGEALKGKS
ncbi:CoA-binding protein [Candidatus Korarchaeum cryptofilum]|jgi:acetyl coenzyme A synthetase (ADP forming)-like protein|uniref:CoA-binding protein n=2 Tax=Candidatus Korarchaeum cryptofilum TaxID=498846 RepID=A0A3R9PR05_9CREN|nr:CoA-binding protein [Candidatus Korarchaeum cryptofilum]